MYERYTCIRARGGRFHPIGCCSHGDNLRHLNLDNLITKDTWINCMRDIRTSSDPPIIQYTSDIASQAYDAILTALYARRRMYRGQ